MKTIAALLLTLFTFNSFAEEVLLIDPEQLKHPDLTCQETALKAARGLIELNKSRATGLTKVATEFHSGNWAQDSNGEVIKRETGIPDRDGKSYKYATLPTYYKIFFNGVGSEIATQNVTIFFSPVQGVCEVTMVMIGKATDFDREKYNLK